MAIFLWCGFSEITQTKFTFFRLVRSAASCSSHSFDKKYMTPSANYCFNGNRNITDGLGYMIFEKHGIYRIETANGILIVDATGPFNEELIAAYHRDLEISIGELEKTGNWGQIVILHDLSVFTPEAEQALIASVASRAQRGLTASAIIADTKYFAVKRQITKIYESACIPHHFFNNVVDATVWLGQVICEHQTD